MTDYFEIVPNHLMKINLIHYFNYPEVKNFSLVCKKFNVCAKNKLSELKYQNDRKHAKKLWRKFTISMLDIVKTKYGFYRTRLHNELYVKNKFRQLLNVLRNNESLFQRFANYPGITFSDSKHDQLLNIGPFTIYINKRIDLDNIEDVNMIWRELYFESDDIIIKRWALLSRDDYLKWEKELMIRNPINNIPNHIIEFELIKYFNCSDIRNFSLVCKKFNVCVKNKLSELKYQNDRKHAKKLWNKFTRSFWNIQRCKKDPNKFHCTIFRELKKKNKKLFWDHFSINMSYKMRGILANPIHIIYYDGSFHVSFLMFITHSFYLQKLDMNNLDEINTLWRKLIQDQIIYEYQEFKISFIDDFGHGFLIKKNIE
jgi:hypothetical protein